MKIYLVQTASIKGNETLQREHFVSAKESNANGDIASVAKPDRGTNKAYLHFSSIAKEFETPILMVNSVGWCDNFLSNGLSTFWDEKGTLVGQLDEKSKGFYDTIPYAMKPTLTCIKTNS